MKKVFLYFFSGLFVYFLPLGDNLIFEKLAWSQETPLELKKPASFTSSSLLEVENYIPPELIPWKDWVLKGKEELLCPPINSSTKDRVCVYPSSLQLAVNKSGGEFTLLLNMEARGLAFLPEADDIWPAEVSVNGQPWPVVDSGKRRGSEQGRPAIYLNKGTYLVKGGLPWNAPPDYLRVPDRTALLELTIDGEPIANPKLSSGGILEITRKRSADPKEKTIKREADTHELKIYRLFRDGAPPTLTTMLRLKISGEKRKIDLPDILPSGTRPLSVQSRLSVTFGASGAVSISAEPGNHDVQIISRFETWPISRVGPLSTTYGEEVWSVADDQNLRMIKVEAALPVDPKTSDVPRNWQRYPAFVIKDQDTISITETHRGEAVKDSDELSLTRTFIPDLTDKGFTVLDNISGRVSSGFHLAASEGLRPGRVSANNSDMPIVLEGSPPLPGVETRQANLNLRIESRLEDPGVSLPISGWNVKFNKTTANILIPPGWDILLITGMENPSGTILNSWTLLDLLLLVVFALIVWKLCGLKAGLATAFFMLLAHQYNGGKIFGVNAIPPILALSAALTGRFLRKNRPLMGLHVLIVLVATLCGLPFLVDQTRQILAPQNKSAGIQLPALGAAQKVYEYQRHGVDEESFMAAPMRDQALEKAAPAAMPKTLRSMYSDSKAKAPEPAPVNIVPKQAQDAYSLVQTGPGIPKWTWRESRLVKTGPIETAEKMQTIFITPFINSILTLLSLIAFILAFYFTAASPKMRSSWREFREQRKKAAQNPAPIVTALLLASLLLPASLKAENFPPSYLLDELQGRLLEPPRCLPDCAGVQNVEIRLEKDSFNISATIDAATQVNIPLPWIEEWSPKKITINTQNAEKLFRSGNILYVLLEPGRHMVEINGPLPEQSSFNLNFPLKPKRAQVTIQKEEKEQDKEDSEEKQADAWVIEGISAQDVPKTSLYFYRKIEGVKTETQSPPAPIEEKETATVEPFWRIERNLNLGLTWETETTVHRLSQAGVPIVIKTPLLSGESILTPGIKSENGIAIVEMAANETRKSWRASLAVTPTITISSPPSQDNELWTQTVRVSPAPIWSLNYQGPRPSNSFAPNGQWSPNWRLQPGESLKININKPQSAPGNHLTVDGINRNTTLELNERKEKIVIRARASRGELRTVALPAKATDVTLNVDGRVTPAVIKNGNLDLLIEPGQHNIVISWKEPNKQSAFWPAFIEPSAVDLKMPAVNIRTEIDAPRGYFPVLFDSFSTPFSPFVGIWLVLLLAITLFFAVKYLPASPLKNWQIFFLALGLTQSSLVAILGGGLLASIYIVLFGLLWIPALELYHNLAESISRFKRILLKSLVGILILFSILIVLTSIYNGLSGEPVLDISNSYGQHGSRFFWTFDRTAGALPAPWVILFPIEIYQGIMFLWTIGLLVCLPRWRRSICASLGRGRGKDKNSSTKETSAPEEKTEQNQKSDLTQEEDKDSSIKENSVPEENPEQNQKSDSTQEEENNPDESK